MAHNENDRIFIISQKGKSRMLFHNQWRIEAYKRGLRYPWDFRPDKPIRTEEVIAQIEGKDIKCTKTVYPDVIEEEYRAWANERDEYMRQRDEWIALKMFNRYGYETFIEECNAYRLTDEFRNSVRPCDSKKEPQCNMFCAQYDNCALRLVETQTQKGDED